MLNFKNKKRQKLIKEMFISMLKENNVNTPIKIRFRNKALRKGNQSSSNYFYKRNTGEIIRQSICLDFIALKNRIKKGFSDYYYTGRKEKLSFVIGNRKKTLKFILYHELKHVIDCQFFGAVNYSKMKRRKKEILADDFAVDKVKEL